jgi:hypothetical protein
MRSEIFQYKTELNERNITISEPSLLCQPLKRARAHLLDRQSQVTNKAAEWLVSVDKSQDQKKEAVGAKRDFRRKEKTTRCSLRNSDGMELPVS